MLVQAVRVSGPRKKWVNNCPSVGGAPAGPTQIDSDDDDDGQEDARVAASGATRVDRPRSRSPRKGAKSVDRVERLAPDERLLQDIGPWKFHDAGGTGDCGYRAVVIALKHAQKKPTRGINEIVTEASKLRLLSVGHMIKHKAEYADKWAFDQEESFEGWGADAATVNFEQYPKLIAKCEVWIDQYQMCALAERIGVPIVVWHFCPKKLTWLRAASAPWWKQETAQTTRKQKRLVLALREKHYRAVLPDDDKDEVEVPKGWLKASLPNSVGSLRGAGDGCGLSLPPSTPSCKSGSSKRGNGALSLPSATPSRKSCKSSNLRRAEAAADEARLTLPACTPARQSSKRASSSHHAVDFQSDVGTCLSEADIDLAVGAEDSPPSPRIWTCKLCSCKFESRQKGRQLSDLRTRHLASRHPEVDPATVPGVQEPILHTKVSPKVPSDLRAWSCPFCNSGLPHGLTPYAMKAAVKEHYAKKHAKRDTSLKAVHKARAKQYRRNPDSQPAIKKGKAQLSKALRRKNVERLAPKGTGHQLVVWQPDWASWPARKKDAATRRGTLVTCCLCHKIGTHRGWDSPCVGALGPRSGPQRALWKRLCSSPANLRSILAVWGTTQREVDGSMGQGACHSVATKTGHDIAWFEPDLANLAS